MRLVASLLALGGVVAGGQTSLNPATGHKAIESRPNLHHVETVLATLNLNSTAGTPWEDLSGLLTNIKKRYSCENAQKTSDEAVTAQDCSSDAAGLEAAAQTAAGAVTAKEAKCAELDVVVSAKQDELTDATNAKAGAEAQLAQLKIQLSEGEEEARLAGALFEKERDETNAAIELVTRLIDGSADLSFAELESKLKALPDGHVKDMSAVALVAMSAIAGKTDKSVDVTAFKALLAELLTELEKYLQSLVDTAASRGRAATTTSDNIQKDILDRESIIENETARIGVLAAELEALQAQLNTCKDTVSDLKTLAGDAETDASDAKAVCTQEEMNAGVLAAERQSQLATVDNLLQMLSEHEGIAVHVKEQVGHLRAQTVDDFTCCVPGTYVQDGLCKSCAAGQYSDTPEAASCTACEKGHFNDATAQATCSPCPENMFAASPGATSCVACPSGETASPGSSECVAELGEVVGEWSSSSASLVTGCALESGYSGRQFKLFKLSVTTGWSNQDGARYKQICNEAGLLTVGCGTEGQYCSGRSDHIAVPATWSCNMMRPLSSATGFGNVLAYVSGDLTSSYHTSSVYTNLDWPTVAMQLYPVCGKYV